jgi:UDP-4-amino-4-deoxy-L-arabinose formyltransferase/UDP-glucuronic acid dehydrogenase (UDP-4-keto-hexauronic acid decarboxylating)
VRAVTDPWPGAYSFAGVSKFIVWKSRVRDDIPAAKPGTVVSVSPLIVSCGEQALEIVTGQTDNGLYVQGTQLAQSLGLVAGADHQRTGCCHQTPHPRADPRRERLYR